MGAYRSKPITEKVSESGEYCIGQRKVIYGATAMQGWRMSMEDAHCVVPNFEKDSSLFGVYDGHGGREVAVYCATHLPDVIKSTAAYSRGDLAQAMKDAFMQCDSMLKEREVIEEMKKYDEDEIPVEDQNQDCKEDLANLLEESSLPLRELLARYNAPMLLEATAPEEGKNSRPKKEGILQLLMNTPNSDSEDSESAASSDESDSAEEAMESPPSSPVAASSTEIVEAPRISPQESIGEKSPSSKIPPSNTRQEVGGMPPQDAARPLHSIHDSNISTGSASILEKVVSPQVSRLEPKSLMDLLTAKPEKPPKLLSPRKRPRPLEEDSGLGVTVKKSPTKTAEKQGYHSGTTAVVGILRDDEFIVANAGDSKCVLASKGKAVDMSFDHKPTDHIELHRIIKAGGQVGADSRVNGGLNLSRAIGDHFYKRNSSLSLEDQMISPMPDIKSVPISDAHRDFIVFACDGIWNSKSSQEVVDFVSCRLREKTEDGIPSQQNLIQICESLCDACLAADTNNDGTGCDNMTCILIYILKLST